MVFYTVLDYQTKQIKKINITYISMVREGIFFGNNVNQIKVTVLGILLKLKDQMKLVSI